MEIVRVDRWSVREVELTPEKVKALWEMLQRYKTLFSDLTRNDIDNFVRVITAQNSMWFEVVDYDVIVGIIWFGDMWQVTDCNAHMVFFDRRPAEKVDLCRAVVRWMFDNFPLRRITVSPPAIYHATLRLLEKIGFKQEGRKRDAVLLGGKWNDQIIFGILRQEVE